MKIHEAFIPGNHAKGRGRSVDMLVIHVMEGNMEGTLSWFRDPAAKVSAHYGISRSGMIVQYVSTGDTAWHAGLVVSPTADLVRERPGVNPNSYSIGIEHEGTGRVPPTAAQVRASVALIRALAERYGIPLTRRHIVGHNEIRADKLCPGVIDVDVLVERAQHPEAKVVEPAPMHEVPNLKTIYALTPPVMREVARVRRLDPGKIMKYAEAFEAVLRIMDRSGVRFAKQAADLFAFGIHMADDE